MMISRDSARYAVNVPLTPCFSTVDTVSYATPVLDVGLIEISKYMNEKKGSQPCSGGGALIIADRIFAWFSSFCFCRMLIFL